MVTVQGQKGAVTNPCSSMKRLTKQSNHKVHSVAALELSLTSHEQMTLSSQHVDLNSGHLSNQKWRLKVLCYE